VLTAEGGHVDLGEGVTVMEQAVVRGRTGHPAVVGRHVLVGPHAHVNGAVVGEAAFLATGVSVFPGARVGAGAEVRINGVVHANTVLADEALVPIGWVAVGDPARVLAPSEHDEIWRIQKPLDFPQTVYGLPREASARERMERQTEWFGAHRDDEILGG
jgi:gamma-carbonic anhydrase